ncbi:hypothetical protein [Nonomuraea sp. NPDC050310]|uniref:hypothetical protein n=1 Tax=Nonomuraea sp. NPDC050310 TaxID=3154935 RepID=UPI0033EE9253
MANAKFSELHEPLVEWVYDQTINTPLLDAEIRPFCAERGLNPNDDWGLLGYAKSMGLLDDKHSGMGAPSANITSAGIRWVEERRRRRADPRLRAAAARTGLLTWLWNQKQQGDHMPVVTQFLAAGEASFEGGPFHEDEIQRAAEYLHRAGLIDGPTVAQERGPVRAEPTKEGDYCVEHHGGDVSEYERQRRAGSGSVFHIGTNTGNIAANSRDFTMNATTTNGVNPADLVLLARALRQAIPVLDLPVPDAEELESIADRIEEEAAGGQPDQGRIRRWGNAVVGILNAPVVSGALGPVLAASAQTMLGLPPSSG